MYVMIETAQTWKEKADKRAKNNEKKNHRFLNQFQNRILNKDNLLEI